MVLKKVVKSLSAELEKTIRESASEVTEKAAKQATKVVFKGNSINKQYNISCPVYNNYDLKNKEESLHKFSILVG